VTFLGSWWLLGQSTHVLLLAHLHGLITLLVLYGTFFVTVPTLRWLGIQYLNKRIESRNAKRKEAADMISNPSADLTKKLEQAANQRIQQKQISEKDVVYTTDKDILEQEFEPPK